MSIGHEQQRGFSLIEMMIAMILGIVVVLGLIQVLISNRKAYQLQEGSNYVQQNLRFASDRIGWSLRMADFWGGANADAITATTAAAGAVNSRGGSCTAAWILGVRSSVTGGGGVYGYDGASSFPLGSGCVGDADYVKGSDVLVLRYADTDGIDPASSGTTYAALTSPVRVVAAVGGEASLFTGDDPPNSSISPPPRQYVFPYRIEAYYLQPCSDRGSNDVCDASDDDGMPIPTLMRLRLESDGDLVREPIVGGIEQMQFEYGIRTVASEQFPGKYVSAGLVGVDWPSVIAVRLNIVSRSTQRDTNMPHAGSWTLSPGCTYAVAAGGAFTLTSSDNDCSGFSLASVNRPDQFPRILSQQVVQVRNRIRG